MDDFLAVGHYLVIAAFIAALARSSFLSLTAAPILSVVLMMALTILLNLCSEADAFIAAYFRGLIPIPAQMAFLLTGPMFDLKLLLMYQNVFKGRAIVVLASLILAAVLAIGVGLEMLNGMFQCGGGRIDDILCKPEMADIDAGRFSQEADPARRTRSGRQNHLDGAT